MSNIIKDGQTIENLVVEKLLGAGGQGEVYLVQNPGNGQKLALKWYFASQATPEQEQSIRNLVNKYQPGPEFLWPKAIVKHNSIPGFGYTMALRPDNYKSLTDLMKRKAEPSFKALIMATYRLVNGFHWLHQKGLCYRDISFGNAFFKTDTGEILICDNDNVSAANDTSKIGVNGTPRFMAPEIVRAESGPNSNTDLFSLAVLNFYFFFLGHPLDGKLESDIKCMDMPAMRKLYGTDPVYIFHPGNLANRPVPGIHINPIAYKNVYPDFFMKLFEKSFVDGLNPAKRVTLGEWRKGLAALLGQLNHCKCGAENFGFNKPCWNCQTKIPSGMYVTTSNGQSILLQNGTQGYYELFGKALDKPFSETVFVVNRHPTDPNIWGLKNTGSQKWVVERPGLANSEVEPGKNLALMPGYKVRLNYDNLWFEIMP